VSSADPVTIDLNAYVHRIGYTGPLAPTLDVLRGLHQAHATHIPFENLDIPLGRPIRLDLTSVQSKLVSARRGGYCFEQNTLLAAVLEQIGFRLTRLSARVLLDSGRTLPRTHMLLKVHVGEESWLADVGFGREGLYLPLLFQSGQEAVQFGSTYRLIEDGGLWTLQAKGADGWHDVYAFSLEPQLDVDYEIANYFVSTHPESRFVQTFTAQLPTPEARYAIRNWDFIVQRDGQETTRTLESHEELLRVLSEIFGLEFPPGTRFPQR
jgi:N-hydroxyarylamine O-acetyltransferase